MGQPDARERIRALKAQIKAETAGAAAAEAQLKQLKQSEKVRPAPAPASELLAHRTPQEQRQLDELQKAMTVHAAIKRAQAEQRQPSEDEASRRARRNSALRTRSRSAAKAGQVVRWRSGTAGTDPIALDRPMPRASFQAIAWAGDLGQRLFRSLSKFCLPLRPSARG